MGYGKRTRERRKVVIGELDKLIDTSLLLIVPVHLSGRRTLYAYCRATALGL